MSPVPSWRVTLPSGTKVVKVYVDDAGLPRQVTVLQAMRHASMPVTDARFCRFSSMAAIITDWASGTPLAQVVASADVTPGQIARLGGASGATHARLHQAVLTPDLQNILPRLPGAPGESRAVLHLDYHPQNVLVQDNAVPAVLDWENAAQGDSRLDGREPSPS